jgi:hypothetical protein
VFFFAKSRKICYNNKVFRRAEFHGGFFVRLGRVPFARSKFMAQEDLFS